LGICPKTPKITSETNPFCRKAPTPHWRSSQKTTTQTIAQTKSKNKTEKFEAMTAPPSAFPPANSPMWAQSFGKRPLVYNMYDLCCSHKAPNIPKKCEYINKLKRPQKCYSRRDAPAYHMQFTQVKQPEGSNVIWNIQTNKKTINHRGNNADTRSAKHNGYISTNMARLTIEWLYPGSHPSKKRTVTGNQEPCEVIKPEKKTY